MDAIKVLMVDDEERMRKLVKDFLTIKGYRVLEAGDGEEAIDIFFKEKDISLVILDVMMPKMDGWEVCKTIRRYSQVPIIMLTARSEERDELLGFELVDHQGRDPGRYRRDARCHELRSHRRAQQAGGRAAHPDAAHGRPRGQRWRWQAPAPYAGTA